MLLCPAAVAIHNHGNVARQLVCLDLLAQLRENLLLRHLLLFLIHLNLKQFLLFFGGQIIYGFDKIIRNFLDFFLSLMEIILSNFFVFFQLF